MEAAFENFLFAKSAQGVTEKTLKSYRRITGKYKNTDGAIPEMRFAPLLFVIRFKFFEC